MIDIKRRGLLFPQEEESEDLKNPVLSRLLKRNPIIDRQTGTLGNAVSRFGSFLTTGKPPKDDTNDRLLTQYYLKELSKDPELEDLKRQDIQSRIADRGGAEDPLDRELKQARIKAINAGLDIDEAGNVRKAPAILNERQQFELDDKERQRQYAEDSLKESAQENINTIQEAKKGIKYFGPLGNIPTIAAPSTLFSLGGDYGNRRRWEANVNKLLSQKVIDVMSEMKRASATGSTGFGQLSNKELGVLQQASTALKKDLTPEDANYFLNELERIHKKVVGVSGDDNFKNPFSNLSRGRQPFSPAQVQSEKGQMIKKGGRNFVIVGYDDDGEPLVEPA